MSKNKKPIPLSPLEEVIVNFLGEVDSPPKTIKFDQDPVANLVVNFPDSIMEHLSASPKHLAVIRSAIENNPKDFNSYFDGSMYLDEDVENAPFLAYIGSLFKWCGCAVGIEGRLEALYAIMQAVDDKANNKITYEEFNKKIQNEFGGDNIFCLLMDQFDKLNLFEHGGSVFSSWLSQDGKVVLKHLQEWGKTRKENK